MGINCPNCGGRMVFEIQSQLLGCTYCGTRMEVRDYDHNIGAQYSSTTYNANLFTCKNCGAELSAPDEQTVAYCSYCGGEAVLRQKDTPFTRPKKIIPFQRTREDARASYAGVMKNKLYVPSEFKKAEFVSGFRGIYLPYWNYSADVPEKKIRLSGTKDYSKGNYSYHEDYAIDADIGGHVEGISYDASAALDDTIASEVAPFTRMAETGFSEAYLAGFYSDTVTTDSATYVPEVKVAIQETVYKEIEKQCGTVDVKKPKDEGGKAAQIGVTNVVPTVSLYPMWFLTWRNKERVAYSVVNGQTGKISADIPVDKTKFFLASAVVAVAAFFILGMVDRFIIPEIVASMAGFVMLISTITLSREILRIYDKENHVYDYGYDKSNVKKKKRALRAQRSLNIEKYTEKAKMNAGRVFGIIGIVIIGGPIVFGSVMAVVGGVASGLGLVVAIAIQAVFSFKIIRRIKGIEKKTAAIPALVNPAILAVSIIIMLNEPASDVWYYGIAIACLIGMVMNCISSINYFNYLTTRPVPNFFSREGANNG